MEDPADVRTGIRHTVQLLVASIKKCPRRGSNPDLPFRRGPSYPLDYRGASSSLAELTGKQKRGAPTPRQPRPLDLLPNSLLPSSLLPSRA